MLGRYLISIQLRSASITLSISLVYKRVQPPTAASRTSPVKIGLRGISIGGLLDLCFLGAFSLVFLGVFSAVFFFFVSPLSFVGGGGDTKK
ncbi:hypothetical protein VU13_00925, partial [Desulfobulbus sp. US5]|nr:hypothetical protein [Desulfobulbus sp. US5]